MVTLITGANADATGVDRYAQELVRALASAGREPNLRTLERREWNVFGRKVGGLVSIAWQRAKQAPPTHGLVHALDPAVATRGADIVTVHDLIPETFPTGGLATRLDWALSRANTRRAPHLVAISQATAADIVQRWQVDPARVTVIHHGIDPARFTPSERRPAWFPDGRVAIYVGDDHPRKNLRLAIEALGRLKADGDDVSFVRLGRTRFPALTEQWRGRARTLGVRVVEPGYVTDGDVVAALSAADVFLWPTRAEGFGFPPLEAMACGTAVVALDTPVNREILGDAASYHGDQVEAAAAAIRGALDAPASVETVRRYAAGYSWARTAKQTLALYDHVQAARP